MTKVEEVQESRPAGRVLLYMRAGEDVSNLQSILSGMAAEGALCTDIRDLRRQMAHEDVDAVLLTEAALTGGTLPILVEALRSQPHGSDLPILFVADGGLESPLAMEIMRALPNALVFERPVRIATLTGALQMALRMRNKQRQVRDLLQERERREEALRESEERYRFLVESVNDWIWEVDRNGVYRYASPQCREMLGYDPDEIVGKTPFDLMPPEEARRIRKVFGSIVGQAKPFRQLENVNRCKDGRLVVLETNGAPILDAQGNLAGYRGVDRDITERKKAEETLRVKDSAIASSLNGIAIADVEGHLTYINPAFLKLWGYENEREVLGKSVLDFWEESAQAQEVVQAIQDSGGWTGELVGVRKDGSHPNLYLSASTVFDNRGVPICMMASFIDITDRKRAEEALRELTATLERRVAQRTVELERRTHQLQELTLELTQAEDLERKRLAEILHDDLQQQLAAVKFQLGMLGNRVKGAPTLHEAVVQTQAMVKDAIEKTRSLSHELSPAVLYHGDFGGVIAWLAQQVQARHGLVVHAQVDDPLEVRSDPIKAFLFRTAQEILFNVIKHARVHEATVRLRRRNGQLRMTICDRGQGFDPSALGKTAGLGLLSIRERVELLGGHMKIRSAPGRGSTFLITVADEEATPPPGLAEAGGLATDERPKRLRVLLADDHKVVREGLATLLDEQGDIEVVGQAANGREAVELAEELEPDVVVMDVAMPLMEGDEATRRIKRRRPDTRVVGLSMFEEPGIVDRMHHAGAEQYVTKTAPAEELLAAVRGA